jgi:hypothetical protein
MKIITLTGIFFFNLGLIAAPLCSPNNVGRIVCANLTRSETAPRVKQEDEYEAKRRDGESKNPQDISFAVRLAGDRKQFRLGEIIPLEMSFASSRAKAYRMDAATYDRSGRLDIDQFHIDPETGFVDPMRENLGFMGGGLRIYPELAAKPRLITYEINEWFRFDQPGKYRLYLTSPRVSRIGNKEESAAITLTSNAVEFEIIPAEKEWQARELQRVVKLLDAPPPKESLPPTERRSACRALRFLGSRAATLELVSRYGAPDSECGFEYSVGLLGSPHREYALEMMEARLAAPDQPVSVEWLYVMTRLSMASGTDALGKPTSNDGRQWREYWRRYQDLYGRFQEKYAALLAQSIQQKTGRAKAVSVNTLLDLKWDRTKLPDVATYFNDLPRQQQLQLLEHRWKQIAGESMLPTLRRLYGRSPDKSEGGNAGENYEVSEINALALRRIYELAPEEGRRLILAEMRRPSPRAGRQGSGGLALTILPDETLPELDSVFMENFEKGENSETHSALIERYGSPNLFPRVRALLDEQVGKMACFEQSRLLAYCLRVDPSGTEDLIRRALAARGKDDTRCYTNVFREVGGLRASQELEKLAIEFLGDPDPEVVIDAAVMLGQSGSAGAEEPLWRRFEQWNREWRGRERELKVDFHDDNPIRYQTGIEQALRMALGNSPAWLADSKMLERLKRLCLTQNERQQVDHLIQEWGGEVQIRFAPAENEWGRADVAQYGLNSLSALKTKLEQFPKGTLFKWLPFNDGYQDEEKEKLFRELVAFLGERGLKVTK